MRHLLLGKGIMKQVSRLRTISGILPASSKGEIVVRDSQLERIRVSRELKTNATIRRKP